MSELEQPASQESTAPEGASPELQTEGNTEEQEGLLADGESEAALAIEEAEDEIEGVKLKGPKELLEKIKAERLMQADYTRKTQELAQHRQYAEQERAQLAQAAQMQQVFRQELGALDQANARLAQIAQVLSSPQAQQADPQQVQALLIEQTRLQSAREQIAGSLTQKQQQMQLMAQHHDAKRYREAEQFLMREVKGWSQEKNVELERYAIAEGIDANALKSFLLHTPAIVKVLDKAAQFDRLQKQRTAKPAAAPATPEARVNAKASTAVVNPDKLSPDEWRKWRESELRKREKKR